MSFPTKVAPLLDAWLLAVDMAEVCEGKPPMFWWGGVVESPKISGTYNQGGPKTIKLNQQSFGKDHYFSRDL